MVTDEPIYEINGVVYGFDKTGENEYSQFDRSGVWLGESPHQYKIRIMQTGMCASDNAHILFLTS